MTPREPDRFDKQAEELLNMLSRTQWSERDLIDAIAAALRGNPESVACSMGGAHSWGPSILQDHEACVLCAAVRVTGGVLLPLSLAQRILAALELMAHGTAYREQAPFLALADMLRALIPPAAAPAAETEPYVQILGEALLRKELKPQPDPLRRLTPEELAKARGISRERFEVALAQGRRDLDAMQDEHDKQRLPGTFKAPPSEPAAPEKEIANLLGRGHVRNPREGEPGDAETYSSPAPLLPRVLAALEIVDRQGTVGVTTLIRSLAAELRAYIAEREPAEKRIAELEAALRELLHEDTGGDDPDNWATPTEKRARALLAARAAKASTPGDGSAET